MDEQTQKDAAFMDLIRAAAKAEYETIPGQTLTHHWRRYREAEMKNRLARALGVAVQVTITPISDTQFNTRVRAYGYTTIDAEKHLKNGEKVGF